METIDVIVLKFTWRDPHTGRSILNVRIPPRRFTAVTGVFEKIHLGDRLRLQGQWVKHPRYGDQFQCASFEVLPPDEAEIVKRYLCSGNFHGIGPASAERITKFLGENTIERLCADPECISALRGFGASRARRFAIDWESAAPTRDDSLAMLRLHLPLSLILRWTRLHGSAALSTLRSQPYTLTEDPWALGFQRADSLAQQLGMAPDAPERLRAALKYILERAAQDGHSYLPSVEAMTQAHKLLAMLDGDSYERLELALSDSLEREHLLQYHQDLYLPWLEKAERHVSDLLYQRLQRQEFKLNAELMAKIQSLSQSRIPYSAEQRKAMAQALQSPVFILTGGPGTGKTSTLQGILDLLDFQERRTFLAAPTGRAARRIEEMTNRTASTLHRLLEYQSEKSHAGRNSERPLDCDVLVVDEISMIDIQLMAAMLDALPPKASLILVGDENQLPSVGPGAVLADLLKIPTIARITLSQVFRQASENDIPHNAQRILHGQIPVSLAKPTHFHLRPFASEEEMHDKILDLVSRDIPAHFHCHPLEDIQVLCPVKRGIVGVEELNKSLQQRFLADVDKFEGMPFRVGDKVIQTRNNYDKDVFNGDIGVVKEIDEEGESLLVEFDREVEFSWTETDELQLAYAITVHKSQGSEYPYVVLVLDPSQGGMLQRRLLYTAVTRAKERLFIVYRGEALHLAVENTRERERYSHLKDRLTRHLEFSLILDEL